MYAHALMTFLPAAQRLGGATGWTTTPISSKIAAEYFNLNKVTDADVGNI